MVLSPGLHCKRIHSIELMGGTPVGCFEVKDAARVVRK
jgi:hypothetical protein